MELIAAALAMVEFTGSLPSTQQTASGYCLQPEGFSARLQLALSLYVLG